MALQQRLLTQEQRVEELERERDGMAERVQQLEAEAGGAAKVHADTVEGLRGQLRAVEERGVELGRQLEEAMERQRQHAARADEEGVRAETLATELKAVQLRAAATEVGSCCAARIICVLMLLYSVCVVRVDM